MSSVPSPRWFLGRPSADSITAFRAAVAGAPFSYRELGESRAGHPAGYNVDEHAVRLGDGAATFAAGCAAIRAWRMFPAPWTFIAPADAPIAEGTVVAMGARGCGAWWLNACRIVYVVDETAADGARRFGFAYGTLSAHVEQGEERFMVERRADGSVWYSIRAFSRPRFWPVRLMKPVARRLQRRFVRDSQRAMQAAIGAANGSPS